MSLNEGQSQVVTSFFSTDSGPLNVLINEMAGTGKSITTISLRLVLPDDCVTVMAAVANSVVERILDVVHVLHPEFPIFARVQEARRAVRVRFKSLLQSDRRSCSSAELCSRNGSSKSHSGCP